MCFLTTMYNHVRTMHNVLIESDALLFFLNNYAVTVPLSIKTLHLFKYQEEGKDSLSCFRLVCLVSAKWRELGLLLRLQPNVLDTMEMDNRGPGMTFRCWVSVMTRWMDTAEVTWEKVYTLLCEARCNKVARDLKKALFQATNVKPQAPPPAEKPLLICEADSSEDGDKSESEVEDVEENVDASVLNRHRKVTILLIPLMYVSIVFFVKHFHSCY